MGKQKVTPSAKAKRLLTKLGYTVNDAERWNHHAKQKQDMFGFIDLVAIKLGHKILYLQVTSWDEVGRRLKKITSGERQRDDKNDVSPKKRQHCAHILAASRSSSLEVWGFRDVESHTEDDLKRVVITAKKEELKFTTNETKCNQRELRG